MKPLLKWVGGKTQIMNDVLSLFPKEFDNYHEPFVGGGSVFLSVLVEIQKGNMKMNGNMFISDLNENLIMLYNVIKHHPTEFHKEITRLFEEYDRCKFCDKSKEHRNPTSKSDAMETREGYFYWSRREFNNITIENNNDMIHKSALLLLLNKTCFRGIYREGPNGFNVPYGNYKTTPKYPTLNYINDMSHMFENVQFQKQDFQTSLVHVSDNDFVYMDPPYLPIDAKSFTGYTYDGFSETHHNQLFTTIKSMKNKFVMSNAGVQRINNEFVNYNIMYIECRRAINSKNPGSKVYEVLVSN